MNSTGASRIAAVAVRWQWPLLAVLSAALVIPKLPTARSDWDVFVNASELLFGVSRPYFFEPGGLSLYANYPQYQVGPLSVLVATPFRLLDDVGRQGAMVAMAAIPMLVLWVLDRWERPRRTDTADDRMPFLAGAVLVVFGWFPLSSQYLHLDDALTVLAMVLAVVAVERRQPVVAGVLLGLAAAAKPWGILFLPMVLAVPRRRGAAAGMAAGVAVTAAFWAPFVLGDPATLSAAAPTVDVSPESVLHLFGVERGVGPQWVRSAQLVTGTIVGLLAVLRGRWTALPMAVIASRMLLDPGTFGYYTSGLLVATFLWDRTASLWRWPWATTVTFLGLVVTAGVGIDGLAASAMRLVVCAGLIGLGLSLGGRAVEPDSTLRSGSGEAAPVVA